MNNGIFGYGFIVIFFLRWSGYFDWLVYCMRLSICGLGILYILEMELVEVFWVGKGKFIFGIGIYFWEDKLLIFVEGKGSYS